MSEKNDEKQKELDRREQKKKQSRYVVPHIAE